MTDKPHEVDPYTQHILNSLEPGVLATLNLWQLRAITQAINANTPYKKHPVDFRVTVNLFFIKFYLVFFMGRDRRNRQRQEEIKIKNLAGKVTTYGIYYLLIMAGIVILLLGMYIIKSLLGIDIFPNHHLSDWIS